MERKAKRISLVLSLLAVVILGVVVIGRSDLFTGRISKLAFFQESATVDKTIEEAFVSAKEASKILVEAALQSGRIDAETAKKYEQEMTNVRALSRIDTIIMAVKYFGINQYGWGPTVNDVKSTESIAQPLALCISNGCLDIDFKPQNMSTRAFVEKIALNLSNRFGSAGK